MDWAKATARRDEKHLSFGIGAAYIRDFMVFLVSCFMQHDFIMYVIILLFLNSSLILEKKN